MTPRVVVFDLGGVVVNLNFTFEGACETAGVPVRDTGRVDDPTHDRMRWRLYDAHQKGLIPCEDMFALLGLASDGLYSAAEWSRIFRAIVRDDHPDVAELIDELNGRGLTTACLSNTNVAHVAPLLGEPCDIIPFSNAISRMQHHGLSQEMGEAKPGQRIYAQFERTIGATGDELLFFDDRFDNVLAARRRGWRAEWIDHHEPTEPQLRSWLRHHGIDV